MLLRVLSYIVFVNELPDPSSYCDHNFSALLNDGHHIPHIKYSSDLIQHNFTAVALISPRFFSILNAQCRVLFRKIQKGLISEKISRRRVVVMAERLLLLMYSIEDTCVSWLQMPSKLQKCCEFQTLNG